MFKKRLLAYLYDIILITLITTIISMFIPINEQVVSLNEELIKVQENYLNKELPINNYLTSTAQLVKDIDKNQVLYYVLITFCFISYFVIYPFYHKGQTIGKKKLKIKVVKDNNKDVSINDLLLRNIIINNLGYQLIQLLILFILPSTSYYITLSILSVIQMIIIITSIIMIRNSTDKKGIHDIIVKTKVIEVEK